ncbi:hypothetical protein EV360DRAFT_90065 [Lentinula raphanica]|nr:hypothetical protein EV360DRAFT_90065 [Lentinula raphanica]
MLLPLDTLAVCAESHPATPYRSGGAQKRNQRHFEESIPLMAPEGPTGGHGSPSPPSIISNSQLEPIHKRIAARGRESAYRNLVFQEHDSDRDLVKFYQNIMSITPEKLFC